MNHEKLKILDLLEKGIINYEQSIKLMEAVNCEPSPVTKLSQNVGQFSKEIKNKTVAASKELDPKFKEMSKTVMDKTSDIFGELSKSLNNKSIKIKNKANKTETSQTEEQHHEVKEEVINTNFDDIDK